MSPGRPLRGRGETGSATTWALPAFALLGLATLVLAQVGGAVVEKRRAESAADLAALAGATAVQHGEEGCAAAAAVARRNRGTLRSCVLAGELVRVDVSRTLVVPLLGEVAVHGQARAGPHPAPGGW